MTPQNPLRPFESEANLLAWQSEIARSAPTPWLAQALAARLTDLLPGVARCHTELRALPRRTRRAWQRQLARSADLTAILEDWSQRPVGRALQKQLARSLAGAAMLLALAYGVGHAETITVTTNIPGIIDLDGKCSLIEAIVNANDNAATHSDCLAGSGLDTIVLLMKATHTLSAVHNSTYDPTGLPVIASPIIIEGNGAKIARKGGATPAFRLIAVGSSGDLTLKNVTLSGGHAAYYGGAINNRGMLTIQNSTISGNEAGYGGGGITNYTGTLTIENSTISGNTVKGNTYGIGGGIANYSGPVTITNSTVSGNSAAGAFGNYGGGVFNDGSMTIENSTISGNKARGYYAGAGGIGNFSSLTIMNSTISGNQALGKYGNYGGGIGNDGTTMTIQNSTISGNKAGSAYAFGGGIANSGPATIENSTISGNKANGKYGYGGGIDNTNDLTITNSTISGNKAGAKFGYGGGIENSGVLTLHRSLISGNKAGGGPEVDNYGGSVIAADFNLFGLKGAAGVLGFSPAGSDIVPGPTVTLGKILGGLKANGGSTKTHALKLGSPAVNAVPSPTSGCTAGTDYDQRGVPRPQGSGCDIGAFELE